MYLLRERCPVADVHLGDVISTLYREYLTLYGDEELAAVATAAAVNDILAEWAQPEA